MISCNEFHVRLQEQLDKRLPPESDSRLKHHADRCWECRQQLRTWQQIAGVIPDRRRRGYRRSTVAGGLAAAAGLLILFRPDPTMIDPNRGAPPSAVEPSGMVASHSPGSEPHVWWQRVQGQEWVAQTMPAVRSVRDGVAPLGRSLMQAVTILTVGPGDQTT